MLGLVTGDSLVHIAKFMFDDPETIFDKLVGTDDPPVTIHHPILIIDRDKSTQNILRPLWRNIIIADIDYSRRFTAQTGINTPSNSPNSRT